MSGTSEKMSPFALYASQTMRSAAEARAELLRPCSRFKSPLSLDEKVGMRIVELIDGFDILSANTAMLGLGAPLNWQLLLKYLHEKNVVKTPRFYSGRFSNSSPKTFAVYLAQDMSAEETDGSSLQYGGFASNMSDHEEMLSKAVGEALERYALGSYKNENLLLSSYATLKKKKSRMLDVTALNSFLPWQKERFSRLRRDENRDLYWAQCVEWESGRATWVPAQLVFWNYDRSKSPHETILAESNTNGCAGHFT